jgi:hypothetical protein
MSLLQSSSFDCLLQSRRKGAEATKTLGSPQACRIPLSDRRGKLPRTGREFALGVGCRSSSLIPFLEHLTFQMSCTGEWPDSDANQVDRDPGFFGQGRSSWGRLKKLGTPCRLRMGATFRCRWRGPQCIFQHYENLGLWRSSDPVSRGFALGPLVRAEPGYPRCSNSRPW